MAKTDVRKLLLGLCLVSPALVSAGPVGQISFLDGSVTIIRNGKPIASAQVHEGFPIENQDTFKTGTGASVEVELSAETGIAGVFRVAARSTACLVLSDLKSEQVGIIELLAGMITVKVNKILGATGLRVRTEVVQLGVRGTQFRVITNANGDLLVLTSEGRVECSDGSTTLNAVAGTAVEALRDQEVFRQLAVSGDLDDFQNLWQDQRLEVLKADAYRAFQFYSALYTSRFSQVQHAYQRLESEAGEVVSLWKAQDQRGAQSDLGAQMREKTLIVGPLFEVRGAFNFLDRFRFNLEGLRPYLSPASSTVAFYQRLDSDRDRLDLWIYQYRYLVKLYTQRNEGEFPLDGFGI